MYRQISALLIQFGLENAKLEVKNVADQVTYSNLEDGVAHALIKILYKG